MIIINLWQVQYNEERKKLKEGKRKGITQEEKKKWKDEWVMKEAKENKKE